MFKESVVPLWRESIDFFVWENFKLFSLATLNAFRRTTMLLMKYFWWLFAIMIVAYVAGFYFIQLPLLLLINFLSVLAVRASVEPKNTHYFLHYLRKLPGYLLLFWSFVMVLFLFNVFIRLLFRMAVFSSEYYTFSSLLPLFIAVLFFVDIKNSFKNVVRAGWRGVQFCFYFFPVVAMLVVFERLMYSCYGMSMSFVDQAQTLGGFLLFTLLWIGAYLLTLLSLSALSVYYTKIKHNHHQLFF